MKLNELSATEVASGVARGAFRSSDVIDACLTRIEDRDPKVNAWAHLDPEAVRRQVRTVDAVLEAAMLLGVPVGIKDIIDVGSMPTGMGSPIYRENRPGWDADCVLALRAAGAIFTGKTVTCEFAGLTPGITANPHALDHTPGGSSSGSAAAVADNMVPLALGTQTGGSVIRPASYCGIVGFKPSWGAISLDGVFPAAPSLDTLGLFARNVDDIELLFSLFAPDLVAKGTRLKKPPTIGLCRTWMWDQAQPETRTAVEEAAALLEREGARVRICKLSAKFRSLHASRAAINDRERAATLDREWNEHRDLISPQMQDTIRRGREVTDSDYSAALELMSSCFPITEQLFDSVDVILTPAVDGEAPPGLGDTGDPRFQSLWTMLRTPAITLPTYIAESGLPVGIQLVAPFRQDGRLLAVSRWAMERLV